MSDNTTVNIKLAWLQGMVSTCLDMKVDEFEAAVVERDGANILSCVVVDGKIVPKFPDSGNLHAEQEHTSYLKAIEAGLSPIWRDESGNFIRREDDADGKPALYLENCSDSVLNDVAKQSGVPVKEGLSRDDLILKLKKHFGYEIEESEESEITAPEESPAEDEVNEVVKDTLKNLADGLKSEDSNDNTGSESAAGATTADTGDSTGTITEE